MRLLYLLILGLGLLNPALASPPLSLKALRTEGVVLQTDWWTCGAAALATLHQLLGFPAGEGEVLALALKHMGDRDPRAGSPALAPCAKHFSRQNPVSPCSTSHHPLTAMAQRHTFAAFPACPGPFPLPAVHLG